MSDLDALLRRASLHRTHLSADSRLITDLAAAVRDLRERRNTALRDRDALQAMVDCCRELVAEFDKPSTRNSVASAMHGELAEIVGYPPVLDEATRETP